MPKMQTPQLIQPQPSLMQDTMKNVKANPKPKRTKRTQVDFAKGK